MQNQFVWVDIPVTDLDRAIAFYTAVSGGPVAKQAEGDFSFALLPGAGEGVAGCLFESEDNQPSLVGPLVYLNVAGRLDDALEKAAAHGGQVLMPRHQIGGYGDRAVIVDSEGNRLALHSPPSEL